MPIIEGLGVSAHAIAQFQDRIAPLSEQKAREMILAGIAWATNVRELPDGKTLRVRTRHPFPFEFRDFCVFDEERGHFQRRQQSRAQAQTQGSARCTVGCPTCGRLHQQAVQWQ